mgnify:CR=1 FL=1
MHCIVRRWYEALAISVADLSDEVSAVMRQFAKPLFDQTGL